jgi:hypothetical protein
MSHSAFGAGRGRGRRGGVFVERLPVIGHRSGRAGRRCSGTTDGRVTGRDGTHDIKTARVARRAAARKGDDATKIGAGAGAIIGAIAGGGKGPPSEAALVPGPARACWARAARTAGGWGADQHQASIGGDGQSFGELALRIY